MAFLRGMCGITFYTLYALTLFYKALMRVGGVGYVSEPRVVFWWYDVV